MSSCSKIKKAENGADVEHINNGAEDTENEDLTEFRAAELTVFLVKFILFSLLAVKYLYYLHTRKIFGEKNIDISSSVTHSAVSAS